MQNLKNKAQLGVSLGFGSTLVTQVLQFGFGLFLARILSPQDYGIIGMISIFLALSMTFSEAGLGTALIQKKNPSNIDYSTVFWFNLIVSVLFYFLIFFSARYISEFFGYEILTDITRVLGLVIIINAFGSTQGKYLNKNLSYKKLTIIGFVAFVGSSALALIFALLGFGVWSLVIKSIIFSSLLNLGWWFISDWKPTFSFSKKSLKELFSFGSKILATSIFSTFFNNLYAFIIGKLFSAQSLGYFSRAKQFSDLPDKNIRQLAMNVFFPTLSYIQDDDQKLLKAYKKILKILFFLMLPIFILLYFISFPMISIILTEKWIYSAELLQYFCLIVLTLPFQSINENILYVKGDSNKIFLFNFIKKVFLVAFIFAFLNFGLEGLIFAIIGEGVIGVLFGSRFAEKYLEYSIIAQVKDVLPIFAINALLFFFLYFLNPIIELDYLQLIILPLSALVFYLSVSFLFKSEELSEVLSLIKSFRSNFNSGN